VDVWAARKKTAGRRRDAKRAGTREGISGWAPWW